MKAVDMKANVPERVETIVIGGGQAGLSVGYHLARRRLPFVILDANARTGDAWRKRWDSLRLFSPARFDGLDGMPFPGSAFAFPTKDEMGDYLESYAARFELPVRNGVKVTRLSRRGNLYTVTAGDQQFEAEHVVIAMANYQDPRVPPFAGLLAPDIVQFHSRDYRNPSQLRPGGVLLVGAGNSGSEIALEVARAGHPTWMSGRDTGHVPFRIGGLIGRSFLARFVFRVLFHRVLTMSTPMGRKARPKMISQGTPLIRVQEADLAAAHVERVPKTAGMRDGQPVLEDGRTLDVTNVIWCTGFTPASSWIELPVFGDDGEPVHERGKVTGEPGLYFVGLHFLYAMSSSMVHGVGRDADHISGVIEARLAARRPTTAVNSPRPVPVASAPVLGRRAS